MVLCSSRQQPHLVQQPVSPEGHGLRVAARVLVAAPDALQVGSQPVAAVRLEQRAPQLLVRLRLLQDSTSRCSRDIKGAQRILEPMTGSVGNQQIQPHRPQGARS